MNPWIAYIVGPVPLKVMTLFIFCLLVTSSGNCYSYRGNEEDVKSSSKTMLVEADKLFDKKQYQEAIELLLEIETRTKESEPGYYMKSLLKLANCYRNTSNYTRALDYFFRLIEAEQTVEADTLTVKAFVGIAGIFSTLGNYDQAHDYFLKAILKQEEAEDMEGLKNSYYNLGHMFFYFKKSYQEALTYFKKAAAIEIPGQEGYLSFVMIAALGPTYEKIGDLEAALTYNEEAYDIASRLSEDEGRDMALGYALQNLGTTSLEKSELEKAKSNLISSIEYFQVAKHETGKVISLNYLGEVYIRTGELRKAIDAFNSSLELSLKKRIKHQELISLNGLAEAYELSGKHQAAVEFLKKGRSLKDSLESAETLEQLSNRKAEFQLIRKERELDGIRREKELVEKNLVLRKKMDWIYMGLLFVAAIFFTYFVYSFRRQIRSNRLLAEKNAEIGRQKNVLEDQNAQIELQNQKLEHANSELTQFAYVASHDLKEPLRTISSFSKLIKDRYEDQFDSFASESFGFIISAVDRMKMLLDDLLAYSRIDRQEAELDSLNTGLVLNDVISNLTGKTREVNATIDVNFENMPVVKGIRTHFTQLFQNIISNGIKFKKEGVDPLVVIDCQEEEKYMKFSIKDNGIGIPEEAKNKIFEMFTRLNNKHRYTGTGIGLATCKKIVDFYKGHIWVESAEGEGSTFFIKLPKNGSPSSN